MATSQDTDLVEIKGNKSFGYFKEKEFLSLENIQEILQNRTNNESGEKMKWTFFYLGSELFLRLPVEFPVTGLQHTTINNNMKSILSSQSFRGRIDSTERKEFKDLSFWSADISPSDIEKAREKAYNYVQERLPGQAEYYRQEITQQFANSPAFNKSASRYGNFTFSLTFSDLLSLYESQFCKVGKAQLSILGTDIYKQEIVHYVVVHSPDEGRFMDLPRVPSLKKREEPLPFVYWLDDTLYWRPESTSGTLKVLTKDGAITRCPVREVRGQKYNEDLCVWNLLTFAFHIPGHDKLEIPVQTLVDNLSACDTLDPFMKDENAKWTKSGAERIIQEMKLKYRNAKDSQDNKMEY